MPKGRLEAFSDGVIAIIITIMVLEFKVPRGPAFADLRPVLPTFLIYALSFVFVGIYWNNHHHMLHTVNAVNGRALWANLHLLFWLSLVPFVTSWMGESGFASIPVAVYGFVLLMAACAYTILAQVLIGLQGPHSALAVALGKDYKGKVSLAVYLIAVLAAFANPKVSVALYVLVALIWLVPDPRIEKVMVESKQ